MKIGLIDVDGHNFPNLPLMKLSAWHKQQGDLVEWYEPFSGLIEQYDKVYMSKVFSFTPDYIYPIYAKEIERGGTGYCIEIENGKEVFKPEKNKNLPDEIEHIYPDYSLYPTETKNTAYGFLTRGCPRNCDFCHVAQKEGKCSYKVSDLSEFWRGQKKIVLCDPNILACPDWKELLQQLIDSKARVDFNQGLDIRLMNREKAEMLAQIKIDTIHFAWDRYEDKEIVQPKFKTFRESSTVRQKSLIVYVLCGDKSREVLPQDLERIYWLRDNGFTPYVMLYDKEHLPKKSSLRKLQGWVNNKIIFWTTSTFEEYDPKKKHRRKK